MKTRPDDERSLGFFGGLAGLSLAVSCLACGISFKQPNPQSLIPERTRAFLQERSQPSAALAAAGDADVAGTEGSEPAAKQEPTVEVVGAVDRPGQLVMGPYVQTVRQAIDAMGGLSEPATVLRIRSGDGVLNKLFAEPDTAEAAVEIPLSIVTESMPIYLRPGDVVDVVPTAGTAASTPSDAATVAAAAETSGTPPSPVASAESVNEGQSPAEIVAPALLPEPTKPTEPTNAPTAEDSDLRIEVAKLRREMDSRLASLRGELEQLREENDKLRVRLAESPRSSTPPPAVDAASLKKPVATADSRRSAPAEPVAGVEKPSPKPESGARDAEAKARPATVLVSGSVKKPGVYPIEEVKTVSGAVRAAGDRTDANLGAVEVRPEGQRGPLVGIGLGLGAASSRTVVDLVAVEAGKTRDLPLRGGEVIFVPSSPRSEPNR